MVRLLLDHGADVNLSAGPGETPFIISCIYGRASTARLLLERGADISRRAKRGTAFRPGSGRPTKYYYPHDVAFNNGHPAMGAWLERIRATGWTCYLSTPRYELVVLRALVARGRARRQRARFGKEHVRALQYARTLDFLFPDDQPQANKPRLPNSVFPLVARYYVAADCGPRRRPPPPPKPLPPRQDETRRGKLSRRTTGREPVAAAPDSKEAP